MLRQVLAGLRPGECDVGEAAHQRRQMRSAADHDFPARQIGFQKRLDVLFLGDAPDVQEHGPVRAEQAHIARVVEPGIDPACPGHQALEAAPAQLGAQ